MSPPPSPSYPPTGSSSRSSSPAPSHRSARKPVPAYVPPVPTPPAKLNERGRPKLGRMGSANSIPKAEGSRPEMNRTVSDSSVRQGHRVPPPAASPSPEPPVGMLNFHRRPSTQVDPLSRNIVGPTTSYPAPSPGYSSSSHARKQSHNRHPSISLTPNLGTKAPIDSFASVEMLQGQRDAEGRRRGNEVFGYGGRYEGRSNSDSGREMGYVPRPGRIPDPAASARQARGWGAGPPQLPAVDVDAQSIASQLREHDRRRGSESRDSGSDSESKNNWRRFSSSSSEVSPPAITGGGPDFIATKNFSFPARNSDGSLVSSQQAPPYALDDEEFMDMDSGDLSSPYREGEKSIYAMEYSSTEKLNKSPGWKGEYGTPQVYHAAFASPSTGVDFSGHRPSIVALPVYPSPSGTNSRSLKNKAKFFGRGFSWLTVMAMNAATGIYLVKRIQALIDVESKVGLGFVTAWCFLAVEILVAVMFALASLYTVFTYRHKQSSPKLRLRGDKNLPSVDVFIVSSGQDDSCIFDAAIAAASMDYPPHKFRVMVLDATNSATLERDISKHAKQQGCPHLSYHRRILNHLAGNDYQTKANTINFGLKEAASFGVKGPGEYIVVFEADMIPERNYLRAALPSALADPRVALVKTGHGFINLPHRLNQATACLMESSEHESDSRSGFVLRRSALVDIGGFPVDSWLNDGQCEALLLGRGFKTAIVDEILQWGMAKATYVAQVNALMVNRLGPLRTAARLRFFMGGEKIRKMSYGARMSALGRAFIPLLSPIFVLLTAAYPFMFTYGGIIVLTPNLPNLNDLLLWTLIMLAACFLHEVVWTWSTGLPSPRRKLQAWVFAAPYLAVGLLRMILPTWLGGYARHSDNESVNASLPVRPSVWKRIFWLIIDPHSGVIFSFMGSVGVCIWRATRDFERGTIDSHQTALTILLTVGWPSMVWVDFLYGSLVPYTCLLFPSRLLTEQRESFVIRDHYSSVARPKHSFKTAAPFKVNRTPEFITLFLILGWAAACVALGKFTEVFD